ncbi:MAG: lysylphosphatidylglycerol synthase transmembrane domain-containing protein [Gemmatimonadota bacterium]
MTSPPPGPPSEDHPGRNGKLLAARLLVSAAILGLLFLILPWEEIAEAARRMTLSLYAAALLGFVAAHALGGTKWRIMMTASGGGARLPIRDTVGCYGAGLFSNLFLPTVVGGDVVRAGLAARAMGRRPEAVIFGSVADRLIDFASLALLLAGGAFIAGAEIAGWAGPAGGIFGVVALGAGLLFVSLVLRRPLDRWPRRLRRRIGRSLVALRHLGRRPGTALIALGLSLVMQSMFIVISAWLGHAVGAHAPLWAWFLVWPLAKFAGMLPVTLGGLGVRDAALASLLVPFGVPLAVGLVASLAWNAVLIGGALLGGLLWWRLKPGRRADTSSNSVHSTRDARTASPPLS